MKRALIFFGFGWAWVALCQNRFEDLPPKTLSLRTGITAPSIPLELQPTNTSSGGETLTFNQNPSPRWGLGADYQFLGLFVTFGNFEPDQNISEYGHTDYFDLEFHSYFGQWATDLYYQNFRGYYQDQTDPIVQRSDIAAANSGFNLIYVFSPEKISLEAAGNGTAIQAQSGGSWLAMLSAFGQRVSADETLAPADRALDFGELGNTRVASFTTVGGGGGGAYTWVFAHHWYLSGALLAALGPQWQHLETRDFGLVRSHRIALKSNLRTSLGYSGQRFFVGISAINDNTFLQVQQRILNFMATQGFIFMGWRFDLE